MSFHVEFYAKAAHVPAILSSENSLPLCIMELAVTAASAHEPDALIHVKLSGHLFDPNNLNSHKNSGGQFSIVAIELRTPKG